MGERVREVRGVTGVPLTVISLPVFQSLASFSKRAQVEDLVVRTQVRAKLLVTTILYSQPALDEGNDCQTLDLPMAQRNIYLVTVTLDLTIITYMESLAQSFLSTDTILVRVDTLSLVPD